jgi:prepilin-type N-terminal cleavage/methylation domain-containing protein
VRALSCDRAGFTLVELLVVISVIGVLVALLLPAVQAVREAARRSSCSNKLVQLILAVHQYEMSHTVYPPGTIDQKGPIQNVARGYHHSWITQILPHLELPNVYHRIDHTVSVYHPKNATVRDTRLEVLTCPSQWAQFGGYSAYAAFYHDLEAPIDRNNNGVFFLNSRVRHEEILDGTSHTMFLGEKVVEAGDLGWMSGTKATLRNTGIPIMGGAGVVRPNGPPSRATNADEGVELLQLGLGMANDKASRAAALLLVGGFGSFHPGGFQVAMGDGSVQFVSALTSGPLLQRLGHRADGKLIDSDEY